MKQFAMAFDMNPACFLSGTRLRFGRWVPLLLLLLNLGLSPSSQLVAQTEEESPPIPSAEREFGYGELESKSLEELQTLYRNSVESVRQVSKDLRRSGAHFHHATSDEAHVYSKEWKDYAEQGKKYFQQMKEISLVLFLKSPEPDAELATVARMMSAKAFAEGRISICDPVSRKLAALNPDNVEILSDQARTAVFTNDFKTASQFAANHLAIIDKFPVFERALFQKLDEQQQNWAEETAFRKQEAEADDLPRVEIETNKGKIVIELFENEAPHTVGNFVNLIKAGFYQDLIFHRVVRNYRAVGGLATLNEMRATGYQIFDESRAPNARKVFRGSVSMVSPLRTSGASEFYINMSPEPFVQTEVRDTVFGRVIEGMEVVEALAVTAKLGDDGKIEIIKEASPDKIVSTRVIRARDHEYKAKTTVR